MEDYTTEALAGLLQMFPGITNEFCAGFLKLPEDNYEVLTQQHFVLSSDDPNCIIDLVLAGKNTICFVEHKVESGEGKNQLLKYTIALNEHFAKKVKHLRYCTKYADPKSLSDEGIVYAQFRWYEVAKFLQAFDNNPLVKSFLEFLKNNKMAQDNTIKSDNLIAMESMRKTIEIIEFHIENSKPEFVRKFGKVKYNKNFNWDQIRNHNRIVYSVEDVLKSKTGKLSEILYGIKFENLKMITRVLVAKEHEHFTTFIDLDNSPEFKKIEYDIGTVFQLEEDLGRFLNNQNADKEIQDWFTGSFEKLYDFISQNKRLPWRFIK
ncbi:PD-(D/E)XK nuclease family protein [Pseudozobellia thermophila]|uniref:PD-(D/E)XK nuclease family protein n=1 Tax=Pseudozobellia thermophila TaxID=192903 RepID=UPI00147C1F80|nr:PD-(D/E)XK nuclease family protein [Pseudozobellia thermophila]